MENEAWDNIIWASSPPSLVASKVLTKFQYHLRDMFEETLGRNSIFFKKIWQRESGKWGGGSRLVGDGPDINRASINFSQVQYEGILEKRLNAATALSVIIHPRHPHCPSIHLHISWTEMKEDKTGTWRLMVDLNPGLPNDEESNEFALAVETALGSYSQRARAEGDKYFYIPTLGRHRGVVHFYLEGFASKKTGENSFEQDIVFVENFAQAVLDSYKSVLISSQKRKTSQDDERKQLEYHTLYFFQVTTLDRGSIAGLVIHGQNDIGILGSLPKYVDRGLLEIWLEKMSGPQKKLQQQILEVLPHSAIIEIDDEVKKSLAKLIRGFYRENPDAMKYLARGSILPHSNKKHIS